VTNNMADTWKKGFFKKTFHIDLRTSQWKLLHPRLESLIRTFGGRIEQFLDQEVDYLVTDFPRDVWPPIGTDLVLQRAISIGVKLMSADELVYFCKKYCSTTCDNENKIDARELRAPFIKYQDVTCRFAPSFKEFTAWPEIDTSKPVPIGRSFFTGNEPQPSQPHTQQLQQQTGTTNGTTNPQNQNIRKIRHREVYCELCSAKVGAKDELELHFASTKHKENVAKADWKEVCSVIDSLPALDAVVSPNVTPNGLTKLRLTNLNGSQQFLPLHDIMTQMIASLVLVANMKSILSIMSRRHVVTSVLIALYLVPDILFSRSNTHSLVSASEDEARLARDLLRDYNRLIRPVEHLNQTVEVELGLSFIQLINVNEKSQVMTSNVWLTFAWNDYQLKWDAADYGGISVLRLPADKVWRPDIVLFNNADGNYEVRYKPNVLISQTGRVDWIPPAIYQSTCRIDVTYFPFDRQRCEMIFGSWTYTGNALKLKLLDNKDHVDLSDYWKSGTWDIVEVPACQQESNGTKWGKPTESQITFYITIRRKTLFYTVNLILPTVLVSFLCILVFYLPAEAGEKVTLGISILLSLVVFLLLVSKILPPTSLVIPLIAKYLLFTFIMNCLSILVTIIIINFNFRGPRTHSMPDYIRVIFLEYLPSILRMRRPKKTRLRWMMDMHGSSPPCNHTPGFTHQDSTQSTQPSYNESFDCYSTNDNHDSQMTNQLSPQAYRATEAIEFVAEHLRCEDEYIQIREDWKYVAMTIDRLQLYLFFLGTTIGTLYIFLSAPHIFEAVDQDKVMEMHKKV
ncbi:Acetylcholine receptor subunit beta-like 1, partial [Fragariocoptes setiger]